MYTLIFEISAKSFLSTAREKLNVVGCGKGIVAKGLGALIFMYKVWYKIVLSIVPWQSGLAHQLRPLGISVRFNLVSVALDVVAPNYMNMCC